MLAGHLPIQDSLQVVYRKRTEYEVKSKNERTSNICVFKRRVRLARDDPLVRDDQRDLPRPMCRIIAVMD
jgi:hypothetical protein